MSNSFDPAKRFTAKFGLAAALTALADWLFFGENAGWTLGAYAAMAVIGAASCNHAIRRGKLARSLLAASLGVASILIYKPSCLGFCLFCVTLLTALLRPTSAGPFNAARIMARMPHFVFAASLYPIFTVLRWKAARHRRRALRLTLRWLDVIVPALGAAIFIALFAAANPVIATVIGRLQFGDGDMLASLPRLGYWCLIFTAVWAILRPRRIRNRVRAGKPGSRPPWLSQASLILSLMVFNLVFAAENALDFDFLWSGAKLPSGVTFASYAHRGAYPLILTSLLAGAFVLLTFPARHVSTSLSRTTRYLVYLWLGQNVFLVASSVLRTTAYVRAYGLSELRLAALVWMFLVAAGLVLIFLRIALCRSAAWLVNANAWRRFPFLAVSA